MVNCMQIIRESMMEQGHEHAFNLNHIIHTTSIATARGIQQVTRNYMFLAFW